MEIYPSFIVQFSEEKGKEISDFTIEDWRELALAAANKLESSPRGRPRRNPIPTINILLADRQPKKYQYRSPRPLGRPKARYYGKPIEWYSDLIKYLRKMCPAQSKKQLLDMVLDFMQREEGGYHDLEAVEKALRRYNGQK